MSAVLETPPYFMRPMGRDDLDEVMKIERVIYPYPWTRQIFIDCLRVGYHCQVCEIEQKFAGYCVMSMGANEAHILNLTINMQDQGRGLGESLLRHMIDFAHSKNIGTIFLEVRPSNVVALSLYEKLGFNQIGVRKDYYPATKGREDAIILALTLFYDKN